MGYATVMNVPRVHTYALAKQTHDNTAPIRGRSLEMRPLGNRRDADTYWVRMNGDDVQFMLYKTPVITYKPDASVVLCTGNYHTVSTHQFFNRVLGIGANASRHTSVITLGDKRYTMQGTDKLTLKMEEGNWQCIEGAKTQFAWRLHRQAATNVRNRYKEFATYFKGVVSLRTEEIEMPHYYENVDGICVTLHELQEAFGTDRDAESLLNSHAQLLGNLAYLQDAPRQGYYYAKQEEHASGVARFLELIKSDQDEDTKHMNFYRAALAVLMTADRVYRRGLDETVYVARAKNITKDLDTILLRAHAREVLIRKELPMGTVSKDTYNTWINEA